MAKAPQQSQSEKEGWGVIKLLISILKKGAKIRSGTVTEEMGTVKGRRRFVIFTQDNKDADE